MATSVAALRALIQQRFPDALPPSQTDGGRTTDRVATGISALDRALPNGGLPRGRLSVWAPQGGATAILRAACHSVVADGERAAWIDGDGTVAGAFWNDGGGSLYLVRPTSRLHALRAAEELLRSNLAIKGALTSPRLAETDRGAALEQALSDRGVLVQRVDDKDFATAAETDAPQGVLVVAEVPDRRLTDLPVADRMRLLILDAVQDPGNVGTMIRTAAALGAAATVALPGTVDLWNAKVVRSGMGSHFHTPVLTGTWDELAEFRDRHGLELWAADASGEPVESMVAPARLGLIVGNEGSGLSSQSRERASRLVALPIAPAVESLNVAVAAGILLYELDR